MSSAGQKQTEGRRSRTMVTSLLFPENLHVEHGAGLGTVAVTPGSTSVQPALRKEPPCAGLHCLVSYPATMALPPNVAMGHRWRHDELTCQLTLRSYPSQCGAGSRNFRSFPVAVRGSSSRNSTCFVHL